MQEQTNEKPKLRRVIFPTFVLLLIVVVAIVGFNFLIQYNQEREYVNKQLAILTQKQQEIADLENKLESAQKDLQILIDKKPTENQDEAQQLAQIKDAYFLVRIAEDRLQYGNDIQTAKQLLQLATERLSGLSSPAIDRAKLLLVNKQEVLNSLSFPDVRETHEKLAVLDSLINTMPLRPMVTDSNTKVAHNSKNKDKPQKMSFDKEWRRSLDMMLEDLKSVVKIRKKKDKDVDLSYVNIEINKAQFKLLIEQIRWAIFYRDAVVYKRSVKNAQDLLSKVFDSNNENVVKFANTLNELANIQMQPQAQSIQDAVNALQALLVR